jgi:hypothetical protein
MQNFSAPPREMEEIQRESAQRLAQLGGSDPLLVPIYRRQTG